MSIIDTIAADSKVSNAQEAAEMAADACVKAKENGTFGVGAILVENSTGKVLAISLNEVLSDGKVKDPTAHAERQIIDWYYEQTKSLGCSLPRLA